MTPHEVRHHIAYSAWASRRLLDAALAVDEEQHRRDVGVSHKSLMGTLEHIFFGDRIWCARAVDPGIAGPSFAEFSPGQTLASEWPKVQKRWADWAASVTEADLQRVVDYKDIRGAARCEPMWQIVLHVVNHATLHRGQVMAMLRQLGVAPPQTDLIFYYREHKVE
ncbi:MAG TPA: DinB family protein [Bryobacteraceae bacterium]|nr:DinB family protein [Bryobacteraceae bacterium]